MRWKIATAAVLGVAAAAIPASAAVASSGTATPCETAATTVTIVKGSGQTATVGAPYGMQLEIKVTDSGGAGVADCPVDFVAPTSGASARFPNGRTTIDHHTSTNGVLREQITANDTVGSFDITATVNNNPSATATFTETNGGAKASSSISPKTISESAGSCATFYYSINTTSWNTVAAYGPKGTRVRFVEQGWQSAGLHGWKWCGHLANGAFVTPGVYTIKLAGRLSASLSAPIVASSSQTLTIKS